MRQKIRIFAAVAGCMALLATGAQAAYSDIPESHWAYDVVNQAADLGVIQGRGDGTFGLGQQVTRAEFAAMLDRLMGWELTAPAQASYADVPASAWYYDAVETAKAHGAVTDTGVFRPDADITREEMAVWLVGALGYQDLAAQNEDLTIQFTDVTDNKGAIAMAYDFGIIEGKSRTSFAPDKPAPVRPRAQPDRLDAWLLRHLVVEPARAGRADGRGLAGLEPPGATGRTGISQHHECRRQQLVRAGRLRGRSQLL